ncbi:MAG: hypothetical protein KatS3mg116_2049 [Elioraea sp.]|nr:MAG: hypothetical protein KatS3mg116_2049 [Elioraea sp.]
MASRVAEKPGATMPWATPAACSFAEAWRISSRRCTRTSARRPRAAAAAQMCEKISVFPPPVGRTSSGARAPAA